ncbi:MAG TPA: FAD-binding oxidoreductase, partial [Candidatus Limnocylindrales bacterium]
MTAGLAAAEVQAFRQRFAGGVILPGDAAYDEARQVWNALHDRYPAIVVRPMANADVVTAIRFAREQALPLVVRGGAHSAPGHSTCDDGLVLDLRHLNRVEVDPATRRARVGGGALLAQLDAAAQEHGLVCPIGVIGHTGVGGLTLGGGMGRLMRRFGLTIDNLRAVELVTAAGDLVHASATEHPDLFWGIRGAGTQFGAVTEFEFELQPFDGDLVRGIRMWHARHAPEVWDAFARHAVDGSDDLGMTFGLARGVPEDDYPEAIAGKPIVYLAFGHCDPANAERDLGSLQELPEPAFQTLGPVRYVDIQTANDEATPFGKRSYLDSQFSHGLTAPVLSRLADHVAEAPGEAGFGVSMFGGAVARVDDDATAFPSRTTLFDMSADAG